jgi:nucleoside-diphosphate-sugar epimerase
MRVVVTGASGFIGKHLCGTLAAAGHEVLARDALKGADALVHLANIAHRAADVAELRRVNVAASAALAEDARAAGVRRFLYLSSLKVHGERSSAGPLAEASPLAPEDAYGRSKLEAERALKAVSGDMELAVLRPPLVYGPGVKANFLALMRAIARGWPLPFASIRNRRSLLYVGNLCDAILCCITAPQAAGREFLLSDGAPVSTPQLCAALGEALGRPATLFAFPPAVLRLSQAGRSLTSSLEVDDSAIRRTLGWQPPSGFEEGIRRTAEWFRGTGG